jgi:hypothetical protein
MQIIRNCVLCACSIRFGLGHDEVFNFRAGCLHLRYYETPCREPLTSVIGANDHARAGDIAIKMPLNALGRHVAYGRGHAASTLFDPDATASANSFGSIGW